MTDQINDNFITDQELDLLLSAKEAGKSFPDALAAARPKPFSVEETRAIKEIWDIQSDFSSVAHRLSPDDRFVERLIMELPAQATHGVTRNEEKGYHEGRGQVSYFEKIMSNIDQLMQMNWKIAAPIAVVAIAVVAVLGMGEKNAPLATDQESVSTTAMPESAMMKNEAVPTGRAMMAMNTMPVEPATGNVDDLVASLNADADADVTALSDGSADIALVTSDSQSVTDLTTAYDETTF